MIADHQPPNKIVRDIKASRGIRGWFLRLYPTAQKYYPQCLRCSQRQAGALIGQHPQTVLVMHQWLRHNPQILLVGALLAYFNLVQS
jgi:hypothetical protein